MARFTPLSSLWRQHRFHRQLTGLTGSQRTHLLRDLHADADDSDFDSDFDYDHDLEAVVPLKDQSHRPSSRPCTTFRLLTLAALCIVHNVSYLASLRGANGPEEMLSLIHI